MSDNVKTRFDLMSLLSEACELEHGLGCSYLYSAFSLKQSPYDEDLTEQEFNLTRIWAGQLYVIAAQEMLHLSQAWNLLTAIGGTPYYMRPNFPQSHKYYPIDLPLKLEAFGEMALKRFIFYELPSTVSDVEYLQREFNVNAARINNAYTVGKLYGMIRDGFNQLGKDGSLFIGDPELQVGPEICNFPEIVKVYDLASANKAIELIIEQGEGLGNNENCHFAMFKQVEAQYRAAVQQASAQGRKFNPARHIVENPVTAYKKEVSPGANPIKDEYTNSVAVLFDDVYSLMLRMLQYVFQSGPLPDGKQAAYAGAAIQIMVRALKPLGEALTQLPQKTGHSLGSGPAFGLYRNVSLPDSPEIAAKLVREGFGILIDRTHCLAKDPRAPQTLQNAARMLEDIAVRTGIIKKYYK